MSRVIRVDLQYEGSRYHGFGIQPGVLTVQGVVERVLADVLGEETRVTPAGRTDSGVHAQGQVLSFRTSAQIPANAVHHALNARLPDDVMALASAEAKDGFDARRSASRRHYQYTIWNAPAPNLWLRRYTVHVPLELDRGAMERASDELLGRHDFSSFMGRMAQQPEQSPFRTVFRADWRQHGDLLQFDCCADAFARHMVRNIVGTLLLVGRGRLRPLDVASVLDARDRRAAGPTAPAQGLMLMKVDYDDQESRL